MGSSVGGTRETRAPHGSSLHLAGTDSIWASLSTRRQLKSQAALTSLEEDSSPLQSAFHIPGFQAALFSHSGLVSRIMGDFTVRFLCSRVRSRTSSHLVPRPPLPVCKTGWSGRSMTQHSWASLSFLLLELSILWDKERVQWKSACLPPKRRFKAGNL